MSIVPSRVPTRRGRRRAALIAGAGAALLGVAAAPAAAAPAQSTKGDVRSGGMQITFEAKRAAGAPATSATGSFVAEGQPAAIFGIPRDVGRIRLSGPITCLETRGDDVSLYYPFDGRTTTGLLGGSGAGVLVSLRKNGPSDEDYRIGFTPMLSAFVPFTGCEFGVTPFAISAGGWQNGG